MPSAPCDALRRQGYQFFNNTSSAALKPCMWCKRALKGGDMCYKHQFYGIDSHRCVQMTPTLRCNQRCLFCWRSFEHEVKEEEECSPETILAGIHKFQKKALAGFT
jgi:tRNA wybutosine-synthesizing protein 1